jgi:hypothetical protein
MGVWFRGINSEAFFCFSGFLKKIPGEGAEKVKVAKLPPCKNCGDEEIMKVRLPEWIKKKIHVRNEGTETIQL